MKNIYLVRHGESEGNVKRIIGGKDFALTDTGKEQAQKVANRVAHLDIELLASSDFVRAEQTAEIIGNTLGIASEVVPAFGEKLSPSSFFGIADDDPKELDYIRESNEKMCDATYRFEDGENFFDIHERIEEAKRFIENAEAQNILVVSHGFFLSYFIAAIILDAKEPDFSVLTVALKINLTNGGISCLQYGDGAWKLAILNDYAHFAE